MNETSDYEWSEETSKTLNEMLKNARKACEKIGLSERFLHDLMKEVTEDNDWSFVIKAHALMETAITHVLSERLHVTGSPIGYKKTEISDFMTRLPLNGRSGKICLGESLGLVQSFTRNFVERLSEIRNFYVHDLRNVEVTIEHYIFDLNKKRQHEFYAAFLPGYQENKEVMEGMPKDAFKFYIMIGLCGNLSVLYLHSKPPPTLLG